MLTRIDTRTLIKRVLIVILCTTLLSTAFDLLLIHRARVAYEEKIIADMLANARTLASSFDLKASAMQSSLRSIAAQHYILDPSISREEKIAALNRFADRNGLVRAGFVEPDGKAYTSDNGTFDASDRGWFKTAKAGCPAISSSMYDNLGVNNDIVVFAEPVWQNDEVVAVLFATQYTAEYMNITQMNLLEKVNRIFVFDDDGTLLAGAEKEQDTYDFFALAKRGSANKDYQEFQGNINERKSAVSHLVLDGEDYVVGYAPIKQHDGWSILLGLDEHDLQQQSIAIIRPFFGWFALFTLALAVMSGFFVWIFTMWRTERDENHRLLNKNDLLPQVHGIRSVNALLREVDHYYADMGTDELAVIAVISITSLSKYEDVLGEKQLTELRIELARKNSLLTNNACHIAYAGHDKYVIFATGFASRQESRDYVMKIQASMVESYEFRGFVIRLDSIGGAKIYFKNDEHAKQCQRLLECAEYAKREAVRQEKKINFHDFDLHNRQIVEHNLQRDFPMALKRNEFTVVYQPQFDAHINKVIGFDAQIRWNHPDYGIIFPSEFIPMALESGYVIPIGHWLIDQVCEEAQSLASSELPVSFKVLSLELLADDFADYLIDAFNKNNLPPHAIALNLSDSNIFAVYEQAIGTIERIKAAGIDFTLDNFGWWLKKVGYLSALPVSTLRISRASYCDGGTMAEGCRRILESVVDYTRKSHMNIQVKGIKNEAQKDAVMAVGINSLQGDYCGRALTFQNAKQLVEADQAHLIESDHFMQGESDDNAAL